MSWSSPRRFRPLRFAAAAALVATAPALAGADDQPAAESPFGPGAAEPASEALETPGTPAPLALDPESDSPTKSPADGQPAADGMEKADLAEVRKAVAKVLTLTVESDSKTLTPSYQGLADLLPQITLDPDDLEFSPDGTKLTWTYDVKPGVDSAPKPSAVQPAVRRWLSEVIGQLDLTAPARKPALQAAAQAATVQARADVPPAVPKPVPPTDSATAAALADVQTELKVLKTEVEQLRNSLAGSATVVPVPSRPAAWASPTRPYPYMFSPETPGGPVFHLISIP